MTQPAAEQIRTRPPEPPELGRSANSLALMYQGLLTATVRVRAGRQQITDAEAFRRKTQTALQDVEREAIAAGYDNNDIKDTHFAVVAFLDFVILNSNQPIRSDWERRPLQEELFGHAHAGDVFFDKLNYLAERRDTPRLGDVLEVYLLCLLLGFQGRYSGLLGVQADAISETVRRRIEHIRGSVPSLSRGMVERDAEPAIAAQGRPSDRRLVYAMTGALSFVVILFILLRINLEWAASEVMAMLS
jgi:type VI secretion system protein ImpK